MHLPDRVIPDSYWVSELLAAGEYPGAHDAASARRRIEAFEAAGIRVFLDLTHDFDGLEPYAHLLTSAHRAWHPIVDMSIPTEAEMVAALDAVDGALAGGERVYVHCWGGIGRTGTVVGCWLVRHGTAPADAIELIRERRRGMPDYAIWPESPQTSAQHRFVEGWRARR